MKNIHFGAGNIGRGFIGQVLNESGYNITFVDINELIVTTLNQVDNYKVIIKDNKTEKIVNNFSALNSLTDTNQIIETINKADLVTTSIGVSVLPSIAKTIAVALKIKTKENNTKAIDIMACENIINATELLKTEIFKHLDNDEKKFVNQYVGFVNVLVDRTVLIKKNSDPLLVEVENYYEWTINQTQIKSQINNQIKNANYTNNLYRYIQRQLLITNIGYEASSYLAAYNQEKDIFNDLKNDKTKNQLLAVLEETKNLLLTKHEFKQEEIIPYQEMIIDRLKNNEIKEDINKLCRLPINKLANDQILITAITDCYKQNLEYNNLARIYAYILKYNNDRDLGAEQLQKMINKDGLEATIKNVSKIQEPDIIKTIIHEYTNL